MILDRIFILAAGLSGAAGVALSATAAHQGGGDLATAAQFLLFHAPALLAVGVGGRASGGTLTLRTGGSVLLAGVAFFAGDLAMRHYAGIRLFPFAAPAGGMLMIFGWIVIGVSALLGGRAQA